jgi:membrane protein DedA with SNARE-associated domain
MTDAWLLYLTAFISPFVQEDAAIIGAATAFLQPETQKMASGPLVLVAMFVGLVISDLWKYWIGFAGRSQAWAQKTAKKKGVAAIGGKIVDHPGKTLLFARFVPGTRIPAYIASGFFGVPFGIFALWIVVSGLAYVAVAVAVLSSVGAVAGKTGQLIVAIALMVGLIGYALVAYLKSRATTRKVDLEAKGSPLD